MEGENYGFYLAKVPDDKRFWCRNGEVFASLEELGNAIGDLDDNTFSFHVNFEKNDFANWIYDVIGDATLAESIRKTLDKKSMSRKVKARITKIKKNSVSS